MKRPILIPETLDELQRETFDYFVHEVNPLNGLVVDKTEEGAPASIAAVGLALSAYPVGVERGFITRAEAALNERSRLCVFSGIASKARSGGNRLQGLLLSLSRHEDRQTCLEV